MASLSSYDKGKRSFQGRSYRKDVEAHLEFQERVWGPVKARKKKLPRRVFFIGNHENRITRALDLSPELEGTIGLGDLALSEWYDEVVDYNGSTPGTLEIDGVTYAHFIIAGVSGRPIGGDFQGRSLLAKRHRSVTVGHSHLFDHSVQGRGDGTFINGLSVGCYQDYTNDWAGNIGQLWRRGIAIKENVQDGDYDLRWVSLDALRREYGD